MFEPVTESKTGDRKAKHWLRMCRTNDPVAQPERATPTMAGLRQRSPMA